MSLIIIINDNVDVVIESSLSIESNNYVHVKISTCFGAMHLCMSCRRLGMIFKTIMLSSVMCIVFEDLCTILLRNRVINVIMT